MSGILLAGCVWFPDIGESLKTVVFIFLPKRNQDIHLWPADIVSTKSSRNQSSCIVATVDCRLEQFLRDGLYYTVDDLAESRCPRDSVEVSSWFDLAYKRPYVGTR